MSRFTLGMASFGLTLATLAAQSQPTTNCGSCCEGGGKAEVKIVQTAPATFTLKSSDGKVSVIKAGEAGVVCTPDGCTLNTTVIKSGECTVVCPAEGSAPKTTASIQFGKDALIQLAKPPHQSGLTKAAADACAEACAEACKKACEEACKKACESACTTTCDEVAEEEVCHEVVLGEALASAKKGMLIAGEDGVLTLDLDDITTDLQGMKIKLSDDNVNGLALGGIRVQGNEIAPIDLVELTKDLVIARSSPEGEVSVLTDVTCEEEKCCECKCCDHGRKGQSKAFTVMGGGDAPPSGKWEALDGSPFAGLIGGGGGQFVIDGKHGTTTFGHFAEAHGDDDVKIEIFVNGKKVWYKGDDQHSSKDKAVRVVEGRKIAPLMLSRTKEKAEESAPKAPKVPKATVAPKAQKAPKAAPTPKRAEIREVRPLRLASRVAELREEAIDGVREHAESAKMLAEKAHQQAAEAHEKAAKAFSGVLAQPLSRWAVARTAASSPELDELRDELRKVEAQIAELEAQLKHIGNRTGR